MAKSKAQMPKPAQGASCPGPMNRRGFLRTGALGLGGLGLSDVLRCRALAGNASASADTSVIFIWLPGGPPHLDMYDMKPEAPVEYRGPYTPIPTNVRGLDVCEHMPLHAKCADRYSVIRSIAHTFADHGGGHKKFLTGRDPKKPTEFVNDYPMVGSVVAKMRESRSIGLPNYISGTDPGRDGVDVYSFGAAYLGPSYTPFTVVGDPSDPKFAVQNISLDQSMSDRLDDRLELRRGFDVIRRDLDASGIMDSVDRFTAQAAGMLTSTRARDAFDLSRESDSTRDRYGRHAWGQRALLARRLVEAGCSFVTMVMENPYQSGYTMPINGTYNWDSHAVNCDIFEDTKFRLQVYDRAVTALIEDVYARGLDQRTLIIVTGEFGRTPRIEHQIGTHTGVMQPGRDHWPGAMSLIVSGGGLRMGQVIGSTTSKGESPQDRPLTPGDLWATMYRHLGIDPELAFLDLSGRPMPILSEGTPIAELV